MFDVASQGPTSYRPCNALGFALCAASLAFAMSYFDGRLDQPACPLCTATRLAILLQAGIFLLAFLHNPRQLGQRLYAGLGLLVALAGLALSGRHLWLQNQASALLTECKPGLASLFDTYPWSDAVAAMLSGAGECASLNWQLLGLTLPQQAVALFAVLGLVTFRQLRRKPLRSYFS